MLTVDWGDGSPIETTTHGPGASPFHYEHQYNVPGNYPVTVTATDDDTGVARVVANVGVHTTADLVLLKTVNPDPAAVGELVTYTMIVTNNGPDTAHNVILMDTTPSNVQVTSSTPTAVEADGIQNWFLGDLASGQSIRVDLVAKTIQQGPVTNVATVVSDDYDPNIENNPSQVSTTIGPLPDLPDLQAQFVKLNTFCKSTKKGPKCTMDLWALVANRGTQRANSCTLTVYLSNDSIWDPNSDMKLKVKRFRSLNPGAVEAQHQKITTPAGYMTSGKFLILVMDEGNLVFEGDETNNVAVYGPMP
jgi:uncharacterized repeat protein (TIGR01451 family)